MEEILGWIEGVVEREGWSEWTVGALLAFVVCLVVQLWYYWVYYCGVGRRARSLYKGTVKHEIRRPKVSVIVTSKYGSEELEKYLPSVLDQSYPDYEVIVVNDGMTEESAVILDKMKERHKNLYTTFLPMDAKYMSRKKMCITVGVKAAHYDYVVFTDPDCTPVSRDWLSGLVRNFTSGVELVVGRSQMETEGNGFVGELWRFDELFRTMEYMGYALRGIAYGGDIRNMAYKKELFFKNRGYATNLNMDCGEADIFISETANEGNVGVETSPASMVKCHKEISYLGFVRKKETEAEVAARYRGGVRVRQRMERWSRIGYYAAMLVGLAYTLVWGQWVAAGVISVGAVCRWGVQCYAFTSAAHAFREKGYAVMFAVYEILIPLITFYSVTIGRIGKKRQELWKV